MAVPWNVLNAYVQRDLHRCCHLLHCHHLRPKFEGDLLRDLPGAEAVHHDRGGEEHHGDPRGSEVQLVLVRGVVPQQGGQPMQQGKLTHFRKLKGTRQTFNLGAKISSFVEILGFWFLSH